MISIKKFSIGIQPSSKMFRITSLGGEIIDNILDSRGGKIIHDEFFTEVSRGGADRGSISLKDDTGCNTLYINMDNLVFTKDYYDSSKKLNLKSTLKEFYELWRTVNTVLKMKDIRRIGIVAEHRISTARNQASNLLLEKYTTLSTDHYPAKFSMKYEDRRVPKNHSIPDINKSGFINVIRNYYDSELDIEHPEDDCINANIDVQRYYSPLINGTINDELTKLQRVFEEERVILGNELKENGLI